MCRSNGRYFEARNSIEDDAEEAEMHVAFELTVHRGPASFLMLMSLYG